MGKFNEIAIVARATAFHDERAFGLLVEKYQSPLRRFFLSQTLGNVQLSEDLAQETFIKAWHSIGNFKSMARFSTWLFRIGYNVLYDYHRSQHLTDDLDSSEAMRQNSESAPEGLSMDLIKALQTLNEKERTCITLQLIEGYPIDKISEITEMPQNTIKSHLRRGKDKLTDYFKKNGYDR
jgi:RNA polymerase sigma-70 factor (ECF subfamily)